MTAVCSCTPVNWRGWAADGRAHFPIFAQASTAGVPFLPNVSRFVQAHVRDLASPGAGFNSTTAVEVRLLP